MTKILKTFRQVADHYKLDKLTKKRFILYMETRWKDQEETHCTTGYASEWANRFKNNMEYVCSDLWGQTLLDKIDKEV